MQPPSFDTARLATLVAAAEAGSLSRAARRLGVQLSTVSRQVADLEATVGAALLVRTSRGVRPTPAGERYVERARHVLRELEAAAAEARGERGGAVTQLRLSSSVELSLRLLPEALAELLRRHPGLVVDVHSDVRRVSLLEEDYDAALRIGPLRGSGLLARRLGAISLVLCGGPEVARRVRSPADLERAEFALVAGARAELRASHRGKPVRFSPQGRCRVGTFTEAAGLAAASGLLALLPSFTAAEWLGSGRLVRLLPGLSLPRVDLHEVHPPRHRGSEVLRELGDLLAAALERDERAVAG